MNNLENNFLPPYCPNSRCTFHHGSSIKFFVKNGSTKTNKSPSINQRFKCKYCLHQFSRNTFSIDFRNRKESLFKNTLLWSSNGMTNNSISKLLHVSERTIRRRIRSLSAQSIFFEHRIYPTKINEDLAYDGFETFTYDQFSPCYINTLVGSKSHFIYINSFSPLNRRGRMTDRQKIKNNQLQNTLGHYPRDSIFRETCNIFRALNKTRGNFTLHFDKHNSYSKAYAETNSRFPIKTTHSKVKRNSNNPLFPVNHLHLIFRHFLSSQRRETIAFQKHEAALMEKIQIIKFYRNFMLPKFVKKNKFDPQAHIWSPAMYLGLTKKVLNFEDIFQTRILSTQVKLKENQKIIVERNFPFSRRKISK
jgi:transposase-like protein